MKWCHCGDDQKGQTNGVGFAGFGPKCGLVKVAWSWFQTHILFGFQTFKAYDYKTKPYCLESDRISCTIWWSCQVSG
jgi:hypothetical protein